MPLYIKITYLILIGLIFFYFLKSRRYQKNIQTLATDLEHTRRELTKLDKTKSEFVSLASHQLRAPLSAIKGYLAMILEGDYGKINQQIKEIINRVYKSNENLIKLVADLLDLSRIERGQMQFDFELIDLVRLVDETINDLKPEIQSKKLRILWQKPDVALKLKLDENKIRQVITNLIDNAVHYTQKGAITIQMYKKEENNITIAIRDTGIGLTPAEIDKIFNPFFRGQIAQKIKTDGSGIGLYIARQIVEAHHGKLLAESNGINQGSTFYIKLPIK